MTLPSPGNPISLNDVRIELESPNATISLNDTVVRTLAGKPTGAISLSDLYGKTSRMSLELTRTIFNFNLANAVDAIQSGYRGAVDLNLAGTVIRGTIGNNACNLYGQFGQVRLRNPYNLPLGRNYIVGYGGAGGNGATAGANNGISGAKGGNALLIKYGNFYGVEGASFSYPSEGGMKEYGNWLAIYGGGGGGGGGGGCSINHTVGGSYSGGGSTSVSFKVAGGGGGAGWGGLSASGNGSVPEGGGSPGQGQTASTTSGNIITSTPPTAGQGAPGYYITQYYSPTVFELHGNMNNTDGGTGGAVSLMVSYQGILIKAYGGNGGRGGVYGIWDSGAGTGGNSNGFQGSIGQGGAAGQCGQAIVVSV